MIGKVILTTSILRILLHIKGRILSPRFPINPILLFGLLLIDAPTRFSQFFRNVVQTRLRFRLNVLAALPETARYHVLNRVISPRDRFAFLFIDLGRPWRRSNRRRPSEKLPFYGGKSILGFTVRYDTRRIFTRMIPLLDNSSLGPLVSLLASEFPEKSFTSSFQPVVPPFAWSNLPSPVRPFRISFRVILHNSLIQMFSISINRNLIGQSYFYSIFNSIWSEIRIRKIISANTMRI